MNFVKNRLNILIDNLLFFYKYIYKKIEYYNYLMI